MTFFGNTKIREGEFEDSLLTVIDGAGGTELLQEAAEFALDELLDDGLIRDIPVVGTIARLYKTAIGIQGYIFTKKLRRLLTELSNVPVEEREKFRRRLEGDKEFRSRVGETLILLLDKLDDISK